MILLGDVNIPCETIIKISSITDIIDTKANTTLLFDFDFDILKYCQKNNIASAVMIKNITEVVYSALLGVKYIIVPHNIVSQAQKIADNYMYDSKILVIINSEDEIEQNALNEIDGVIYLNRIQNEK